MDKNKIAFTVGVLVIGFALYETVTKKKKCKNMGQPEGQSASQWKRNECAIIQSRFGINTDQIPVKDLTIYPDKNGDPHLSALSKAITALKRGQDEYYEQAETIKRQHVPCNASFIPREAIMEQDLLQNRPIRIPDASDVNYAQQLLAKGRLRKGPVVRSHDFVPVFDNVVASTYFEAYVN
jgi:hypothetical protein